MRFHGGKMNEPNDRYSRQALLPVIGREGQKKLIRSSVLIVGCGALGCVQADQLVRAGVGQVTIVDRDVPERNNLQRQMLFDEQDAKSGIPKAETAARKLRQVNSSISIDGHAVEFSPRNASKLVDGVDLVLDGSDNFETRYLINDICIKRGIPWIYGGVVGTSGMTMVILPGKGPCLRCLFPEPPPAGSLPTCDTQGVLGSAPALVASLQVTEALKIISGSEPICSLLSIDLWTRTIRQIEVAANADCSVCGKHRFDYLEGRGTSFVTSMCGRNAIQISPPGEVAMPLERLKDELASSGSVEYNGHVLKFAVDSYEMLLFPDGRAIVKGTTDAAIARSLYARYLGA
jgi:molybdopterin/thiamine biosynthesis adenylyltransferase